MEVVGKSLFEANSKSFVQEIKERVDKRGWNSYKPKIKDPLDENRFVFLND
jgi:hypothetical protein